MRMKIEKSQLQGRLFMPASKSLSHRVLIAAALAKGSSILTGVLDCEDTKATCEGLELMGACFNRNNALTVQGGGPFRGGQIHCRESGSTLRFLIPISLLSEAWYTFTGSGRLVERPLNVYTKLFKEQEVSFDYKGQLPFSCKGPIKSGLFSLSGQVSSQFISGLLFALPLLKGDSRLTITDAFESKGYVDLTCSVLKTFGIEIRAGESYYDIPGGQSYKPTPYQVEGDYSQAAFWIVAGILGGKLELDNLRLDSDQGDMAILSIVKAMGGTIERTGQTVTVYPSQTKGILINAAQIPDLVPILAVLAALSKGETHIVGAHRVRLKESDRLKAIATEINKLGGKVEELDDGLYIQGVDHFTGCLVDGWNDHRIVMALAVAALKTEGVLTIEGSEAIDKSYPNFFEDYKCVGGQVYE